MGKEDDSPVTVADFGAQAIVAYTLQESLPAGTSLSLVAEENAESIRSGLYGGHKTMGQLGQWGEASGDAKTDHGTGESLCTRHCARTIGARRSRSHRLVSVSVRAPEKSDMCEILDCRKGVRPENTGYSIRSTGRLDSSPIDSTPSVWACCLKERSLPSHHVTIKND